MTVPRNEILVGDCAERMRELPAGSVDCVLTSPPYWALRDYAHADQIGLEPSWREHLAALHPVFTEAKRVLKPTGNLFVNYGDVVATGAGASKNAGGDTRPDRKKRAGALQPAMAPNRLPSMDPRKHKLGLAWRLRFMLNDDLGFISRADIIWHKPNQMPLSMADRVTPKYEMVFHFVKQPRYWYDLDPIRVPFSPATVLRMSQQSLDQQEGGPKDYGGSQSQLRARRNLAKKFLKPVGASKKGAPPGSAVDRAARVKTLEAPALAPARGGHLRPAPEPGEEGAFHPLGANPGDVWTIGTQPFNGAHFATFPEELVRRLILSGCPSHTCADCGKPWSAPKEEVDDEAAARFGAPRPTCDCPGGGSRPRPRPRSILRVRNNGPRSKAVRPRLPRHRAQPGLRANRQGPVARGSESQHDEVDC